ncbi:MAG TPA: GAF domain-containing protein, partial [Chloroflexota bacterium]|nr:GAF domain-containing protein [Chloroflexota bacterium]
MADDAATVAQLRAELRQLRGEHQRLRELFAASEEREQATAEVLRVIASSPADLDRVLDAVAERAMRLCEASNALVFEVDGDEVRRTARAGPMPALPIGMQASLDGTIHGRAIRECSPVHVPDVQAVLDEYPVGAPISRRHGTRTALAVPLLRDGVAVGAIYIRRAEVRPFTEREIALVATFADQAVIAIENARLFSELQESNRQVSEALEQQTATAEVLRVIASRPRDLRSVLQSVVESAARLCAADNVGIWRADGDSMERMVNSAEGLDPKPGTRTPLDRGMPSGRVMLDGQTIHILDLAAVRAVEFPTSFLALGHNVRVRTYLSVPLLREGVTIGAMSVERSKVHAFTEAEIALLETFADQAVIAIENARLFEELQESNARATEALEQQTALGEVLRVIAASPTDPTDVLQAIADTAARLCEVDNIGINRVVGDEIERVANANRGFGPLEVGARRSLVPSSWAGRAILGRQTVRHDDFEAILDAEYPAQAPAYRESLEERGAGGIRSLLVIPLLREDDAIGALIVTRYQVRPFTEAEIALLETFADQAVIAIENARLFQELQERTAQLTRSVEEQRALAEVSQAVS